MVCTCGITLKLNLSKGSVFKCPNCAKHWDFNTKNNIPKKAEIPKPLKHARNTVDRFNREQDLDYIKEYLTNQYKKRAPITFYYRQDNEPRHFGNYLLNDMYIQVKSSKGYYIKFLIDKIRRV